MAAIALSALAHGCLSTDEDPGEALPVCVASEPAPDPSSSVVMVRADVGEAGQIYCSGVVIAPTLVLTSLLCTGLPPHLDFTDLDDTGQRVLGGSYLYRQGSVDYAEECRASDGSWATTEHGDFSARVGEWLEPSALGIVVPPLDPPTIASSVSRIIRPRNNSRCWDTLAVLVLDRDLGLPAATLRLEEQSLVGDAVTMSGVGIVDENFARVVMPSRIDAVTFETGDPRTPPRSLLLQGPICEFQTGGPVVSEDTGSVIGLIAYGTDFSCVDEEAPSIATRLAPFRRLLLDAARTSSQTLRVEAPAGAPDPAWSACAP